MGLSLRTLKRKLKLEANEVSEKIGLLKIQSADGKFAKQM